VSILVLKSIAELEETFLVLNHPIRQLYSQIIIQIFPSLIRRIFACYFDTLMMVVRTSLSFFLVFLRYDWLNQFKICIDLFAYDRPGKTFRFTIIYHLLSIVYNVRFIILTQTNAYKGVETISHLFRSANWSEREIWDIIGIFIYFHPDLRRLLTDYGFSAYPLRKDFPLTGYNESVYSDFVKNIIKKKVELTQELRKSPKESHWVTNEFIKDEQLYYDSIWASLI
jgi:NADH:ubiquinone oxidoreductase subunit C